VSVNAGFSPSTVRKSDMICLLCSFLWPLFDPVSAIFRRICSFTLPPKSKASVCFHSTGRRPRRDVEKRTCSVSAHGSPAVDISHRIGMVITRAKAAFAVLESAVHEQGGSWVITGLR
jgi:hypothetical protein